MMTAKKRVGILFLSLTCGFGSICTLTTRGKPFTQAQVTISEKEPNDSPSGAQLILPLPAPRGGQVTVLGSVGASDLGSQIQELTGCPFTNYSPLVEDWFQLDLPVRDNLRIELTGEGADFDLYLFSAATNTSRYPEGARLLTYSIERPPKPDQSGPLLLEAGKYFIGVDRVPVFLAFLPASYSLTVTRGQNTERAFSDNVVCGKLSRNDIRNVIVVNRYVPSRYPASLTEVSLYFVAIPNRPSPAGAIIRMVAFVDPLGRGLPPENPSLLVDLLVITQEGENKIVLPDPRKFTSGDIYVGFVVPDVFDNPISITIGRQLFGRNTFLSHDSGKTFQPMIITDGNELQNAYIRPVFVLSG